MKAEKPAYSLYYSEVRKELEERNILVANQIYISEDTHYLKKMIPAIVTLNHDKIKVHFIKSQHKEENHKHSPKT